jgi:hypothetical protein
MLRASLERSRIYAIAAAAAAAPPWVGQGANAILDSARCNIIIEDRFVGISKYLRIFSQKQRTPYNHRNSDAMVQSPEEMQKSKGNYHTMLKAWHPWVVCCSGAGGVRQSFWAKSHATSWRANFSAPVAHSGVQIGRRVEAANPSFRIHLVCDRLFAVCLLIYPFSYLYKRSFLPLDI